MNDRLTVADVLRERALFRLARLLMFTLWDEADPYHGTVGYMAAQLPAEEQAKVPVLLADAGLSLDDSGRELLAPRRPRAAT